jgi:hypothetical protein
VPSKTRIIKAAGLFTVMMKIRVTVFLLAAAAFVLFPTGSAEATMYVDSEERRSAMFGTFLLVSLMMGVVCVLTALVAKNSDAVEPEMEPSSVVVPPIRQESNIEQHPIIA